MKTTLPWLVAVVLLGCGGGGGAGAGDIVPPRQGDGLDTSRMSEDAKRDYAVFAQRCSKCHGLGRPLALATPDSTDEFWVHYVDRMRRQPGSGITPEDGETVLRFLRSYVRAQREQRARGAGESAPAPTAARVEPASAPRDETAPDAGARPPSEPASAASDGGL